MLDVASQMYCNKFFHLQTIIITVIIKIGCPFLFSVFF